MPRSIDLLCPSGLTVKLRSVKGKDLDVMRDNRRLATGEAISDLLDACTVEVVDRSIYSGLPQFSWADALLGDRMRAVIGLREATNGSEYDFRTRCTDTDCRALIDWSLDLSDLPITALSQQSKDTYLAGNRFVLDMLGHEIVFKLSTGRDQIALAKLVSKLQQRQKGSGQERVLLALASRITSVSDVTDITGWLEDQDLSDLRAIIKAMDEADCGVETTIEITCSGKDGCGLTQEVELPLDRKFFAPDL